MYADNIIPGINSSPDLSHKRPGEKHHFLLKHIAGS
jgi:hypothetical protein